MKIGHFVLMSLFVTAAIHIASSEAFADKGGKGHQNHGNGHSNGHGNGHGNGQGGTGSSSGSSSDSSSTSGSTSGANAGSSSSNSFTYQSVTKAPGVYYGDNHIVTGGGEDSPWLFIVKPKLESPVAGLTVIDGQTFVGGVSANCSQNPAHAAYLPKCFTIGG